MNRPVLTNNEKAILVGTAFFAVLFSPLISWGIAMYCLILFTNTWGSRERILLGLTVVLSSSLIIASREVFIGPDDLVHYYKVYEALVLGDYSYIYYYGQGMEVGLPIFYAFVALFLGELSPSAVVFITVFFTASAFLVWLYVYGLSDIEETNHALAIASSFLFFSFLLSSQLIRQMLGMVFLLFAISSPSRLYSSVFVVIASSFHLTAAIFFVIIKMSFSLPRATFISLSLITASFIFFQEVLFEYFIRGNWHFPLVHKMSNYSFFVTEFSATDLSYMKYFLVLLALYMIPMHKDALQIKWRYIVFSFAAFYFLLLPIYLGSTRVTLIVHSVLFGYLLFIGLRKKIELLQITLLLYVLYKAISTFKVRYGFQLWTQYDWFYFSDILGWFR